MIDPDLINISLVPASKISHLEIENVSKIKSENKILKNILIVLTISIVLVVLQKKINSKDSQLSN